MSALTRSHSAQPVETRLLPVSANAPVIGECVYCGSTDAPLHREHAIPYGLNGPWTLIRASCGCCADITHRFERDTLRCLFPAVRAVLAFQTRRPSERRKTLPLVLESSGMQRTVEAPLAEFPLYLPIPVLPPPGVVVGRSLEEPIPIRMQLIHVAGPTMQSVSARYSGSDVDFVGARVTFAPQDLARTLAKIAYCAAVYHLGVAALRASPIRRVILGEDPHAAHWVGAWTGDPMNAPQGLHAMMVRASGTDIHVILRLFAQFGAPEYHVALGPADPDFAASAAWPWK